MRQFDYYEFAGVLAPGATLLFGLCILFPALASHLQGKEFTAGDFGVFVLLAYVAGQLIQAFGNVVEEAWWKAWRGWPTDWPRSGNAELLSVCQRTELRGRLSDLLHLPADTDPFRLSVGEWVPVVRQVDAEVQAAQRNKRLDAFNGIYGLNRGLAAALAVLMVLTVGVHGAAGWKASVLLTAGTVIALCRMHRFGRDYARELFVQYLSIRRSPSEAKLS